MFGIGEKYRDICPEGSCMSLLSFQVLVLMLFKPFPKLFFDIIWPWMVKKMSACSKRIRRSNKISSDSSATLESENSEDSAEDYIIREYNKPNLQDFPLSEYAEKVIEFGYIMVKIFVSDLNF